MQKQTAAILIAAILIVVGGWYFIRPEPKPAVTPEALAHMDKLAAEFRKYGPETKRTGGWKSTCWRDRMTDKAKCGMASELKKPGTQTQIGRLSIYKTWSGSIQVSVYSDNIRGVQWLKYRIDDNKFDSLACEGKWCSWELKPDGEVYSQITAGERFYTIIGDDLLEADMTMLDDAWAEYAALREKWGAE